MAQQIVTLNPGESKVVSFTVTPNEAKIYTVQVDDLSGTLDVSGGIITMIQLVEGTNIICYSGSTTVLPEALTNIGPAGLGMVDIIWARGDWTGGEWRFYDAVAPHGNTLHELENGRAYIIVVTEACTWNLP